MRFENVSAESVALLQSRITDRIKWLDRGYSIEVISVEFYRDMGYYNSYRAIIKYRYK